MERFLFYDTETTGFSDSDYITQIAAILTDENFNELEDYNSLIRSDGRFEVPKTAFFIENNMSTERCDAEGSDALEVMTSFMGMVDACDIAIAYNDKFDKRMISNSCKRLGIENLLDGKRTECAMKSMARHQKSRVMKLGAAHIIATGKPLEDAHDAFADVRGTIEVYKYINKPEKPPENSILESCRDLHNDNISGYNNDTVSEYTEEDLSKMVSEKLSQGYSISGDVYPSDTFPFNQNMVIADADTNNGGGVPPTN